MGIKIWWTRVEVWLKNTRVSVANEFVFCQNLNESPSNLNLHELPWSNTFLPRRNSVFSQSQHYTSSSALHACTYWSRVNHVRHVYGPCITPCARDPRSVKDVAWMYSPRFTFYVIVNSSKQPPSSIPQAQPRRIEICEQRLFWEWDQDLLHCHFHW